MSRLQCLTHTRSGNQRSTVKTLSFAMTHFVVAFTVAYLLTGDVVIGGLLALVEPAVNTVAYHFHEKLWLRLAPGRTMARTEQPATDAGPGDRLHA